MRLQGYTIEQFMSIIVELTVPAEQFALYETLSVAPEMSVEVERVIAHGPDQIMPYFWTSGGDYEQFDTAAEDDPSIANLERLHEVENAVLYRADWIQHVESVAYAYIETEARLLEATGRNDQWELHLRFDTEEDVTQFNDYLNENDLEIDLNRLYEPSHPSSEAQRGLTDLQRETIIAGLESGYYEIPRKTTPGELAEEFGISQQALSKRFRRAHRALAETAFSVTPPEDD
jgi:predicted DNA binding protein